MFLKTLIAFVACAVALVSAVGHSHTKISDPHHKFDYEIDHAYHAPWHGYAHPHGYGGFGDHHGFVAHGGAKAYGLADAGHNGHYGHDGHGHGGY